MSCLPLPEHGKFCDLNVPFESVAATGKKLAMLVQLGYEVVAFSKFLESSASAGKKKKFEIPTPPPELPLTPEMMKYFNTHRSSLMQFTRLTIELKQVDDLIKVRDALNYGKYDIIAVVPCNEQLFLQSCTELNIDIISLDCSSAFSFIPAFKLLSSASKRGICFEINYSPMIRDSSVRNCTVSNAQKLSRVRKFSNLILSSGCLNPMELRGPYDVANLNCLFSLPESTYIHTVSKHCRAAIVHGFIRKTAKGAVYVQEMTAAEQCKAEKELALALQTAKNRTKKEAKILKENNHSNSSLVIVEPNATQDISKKEAKKLKKSEAKDVSKKKAKKLKKSEESASKTSCSPQLMNVSKSNEVDPIFEVSGGERKSTKKLKKKDKKGADSKASKKVLKSADDTDSNKLSKPTKTKKNEKRKSKTQSEKVSAKRTRMTED